MIHSHRFSLTCSGCRQIVRTVAILYISRVVAVVVVTVVDVVSYPMESTRHFIHTARCHRRPRGWRLTGWNCLWLRCATIVCTVTRRSSRVIVHLILVITLTTLIESESLKTSRGNRVVCHGRFYIQQLIFIDRLIFNFTSISFKFISNYKLTLTNFQHFRDKLLR